ncbi:hypothetical protein GCM10010182_63090 [Actinomadura cremea]|nr:hypothetical protein GCM10010182_63090 [Actinomadura cremea]
MPAAPTDRPPAAKTSGRPLEVRSSRLALYDLVESLDMSITPRREAIRRLSSEGLVTVETRRDVGVSTMNSEEARQLFEARLSPDPTAAELAAPTPT